MCSYQVSIKFSARLFNLFFCVHWLCKTSSLRRLIYMHQLTRVKVASQYACYSNESLLHQEQNSWSTMYLTIFYRDFQRLSHIANTWSIRDSHSFQTRICKTLLITSFDAYIEVCSLESESRFDNRLFVSDLNRCKSFIRLWFESLHYLFSTRSKLHEIWCSTNQQSFRVENRHFSIRLV